MSTTTEASIIDASKAPGVELLDVTLHTKMIDYKLVIDDRDGFTSLPENLVREYNAAHEALDEAHHRVIHYLKETGQPVPYPFSELDGFRATPVLPRTKARKMAAPPFILGPDVLDRPVPKVEGTRRCYADQILAGPRCYKTAYATVTFDDTSYGVCPDHHSRALAVIREEEEQKLVPFKPGAKYEAQQRSLREALMNEAPAMLAARYGPGADRYSDKETLVDALLSIPPDQRTYRLTQGRTEEFAAFDGKPGTIFAPDDTKKTDVPVICAAELRVIAKTDVKE